MRYQKKKFKNVLNFTSSIKGQRGSVAVMVALAFIVLLGAATLSIDVGYLFVTRNELQNIADAGSLAGARELGRIYEGMTLQEQYAYVFNPAEIEPAVTDVAFKNKAAYKNIVINSDDIVIGKWDTDSKSIVPTLNQPDAVQVTARRDEQANDRLSTIFARVFGEDSVPVSAVAIAALTAESKMMAADLPLPVGISRCVFEDPNNTDFCGRDIVFYPTTYGEAGWHTFFDWPSNAATLTALLTDIKESIEMGTYPPPQLQDVSVEIGDEIVGTGGTLASSFPAMKELFDTMKVINEAPLDQDEDPNTWTTAVVVYDANCGEVFNPAGWLEIVAFATVVIEEILTTPDGKVIVGHVQCDIVSPGRGGGSNYYGTKGSIPGLVK